jgi:hypothetical protein
MTGTAAWLLDETRASSEDFWSTVEQNAELLDLNDSGVGRG